MFVDAVGGFVRVVAVHPRVAASEQLGFDTAFAEPHARDHSFVPVLRDRLDFHDLAIDEIRQRTFRSLAPGLVMLGGGHTIYVVIKQFYGPGGACPNPAVDWNQSMLGTLGEYDADVKNFRYYLADGTYHTILRSPLYYTESSPGIVFSSWLGAMLQNRGGTGGHGGGNWKDVACPTCLQPVPCQ